MASNGSAVGRTISTRSYVRGLKSCHSYQDRENSKQVLVKWPVMVAQLVEKLIGKTLVSWFIMLNTEEHYS
jgi:hypothetical protein